MNEQKTILLVIAGEGFNHIEYGNTRKALDEAGVQVAVASDALEEAIGKDGSRVRVDVPISAGDMKAYDAVYLIGGPGALDHLDKEPIHTFLKNWQKTGKPYGAICIAPRILAHAGLLAGKKATGWNEDGELSDVLDAAGATYVPEAVVQDEHVITADGPASATAFGNAIVKQFQS